MEYRNLITVCENCNARVNTTNFQDGHVFLCGNCNSRTTVARGVDMLNDLFHRATQLNASDIHLEPVAAGYRARFRVDGLLRDAGLYPREIGEKAVSRAKLLARANIAEKRLHQDGSFQFEFAKIRLDVRMSSYVTIRGENLVLRLINRQKTPMSLMDMKLPPQMLADFIDFSLGSPAGVILFAGPTGCGKTTTLYACIAHLRNDEVKVITAEDPVEVVLDGVSQCSINNEIERTYESSLKAIVRQDPDIILLGEIRDRTSAATAVEAALTGHKVLSTLHTEDCIGGLLRLMNLDIEPFLVASGVHCIVSQRLVRRRCPPCRPKDCRSEHQLAILGVTDPAARDVVVCRPGGCKHCDNTGYKGRTPVFEILHFNQDMRAAIIDNRPVSEIRRVAYDSARLLTLREYGMLKVFQGVTSAAEIIRVTPPSGIMRSYDELISFK